MTTLDTAVTSSVSSLDDRMGQLSRTLETIVSHQTSQKSLTDSMFQELLQLKQNNEVDQIILRGNAHMDQFIQLPQDAIDQGERNFPAHKIGAFIPPHSHSEEAEEKLNALTYFQIIKLIQTSPNFIMHKGVICPRCQTSTYHKASSQCDICKGHYHTHCEELLAMHPDEYSRISSCSYCRNIQFHEFSMQLMLDCPHCRQWVAEKKRD